MLNKRLRPDRHDSGVGITWRMTCSGGAGRCSGVLRFSPPEVLAANKSTRQRVRVFVDKQGTLKKG